MKHLRITSARYAVMGSALCLSLSACTSMTSKLTHQPCDLNPQNGKAFSSGVVSPYDYHSQLLSMNQSQLQKEKERAAALLIDHNRSSDRIRYALALSQADPSVHGLSKARRALEDPVSVPSSADCDADISRSIAAQLKALEVSKRQTESLARDKKELLTKLKSYKADALTKTEQLEQLKAIEEQIDERQEPDLIIPETQQP